MSKRYVIQVCQWNHDCETGELAQKWENVQHPSGNGDWMTRSKTTALNDAVTLVLQGETRPLRIAISQPVYSTTPVAELDVAEAVAIAKQITADTAAEIAKYGYGEPGDDDHVPPIDVVELESDVADAQFEVVEEKNTWTPGHPPQGN